MNFCDTDPNAMQYYVHDPDVSGDIFKGSLEEAVKDGERVINEYRNANGDGIFPREVEEVGVYAKTHEAVGTSDYHLRETEAGKLLRLAPAVIAAAEELLEHTNQDLLADSELLPRLQKLMAACWALRWGTEPKTSEGTDGE